MIFKASYKALLCLLVSVSTILCIPSPDANKTVAAEKASSRVCDKIEVRRPWSKASVSQRRDFLAAQACLATKAGKFDRRGRKSVSVHDDFVLLHVFIGRPIHGQALFLPCHRLLLSAWFKEMQSKCGYTGDILYFDLSTYADDESFFTTSDLWSSDLYGGITANVTDGVQKDHLVHWDGMHPNILQEVNRPLQRELTLMNQEAQPPRPFIDSLKSNHIRSMLELGDFEAFRSQLEGTTHFALHRSVGGEADLLPLTSPNDLFFFSIHSAIDMIWNAWQLQNNATNRDKFYGVTRVDPDSHRGPTRPVNATEICPMLDTWSSDYSVADLLDVGSMPNCYRYDFPESFKLQGVQQ